MREKTIFSLRTFASFAVNTFCSFFQARRGSNRPYGRNPKPLAINRWNTHSCYGCTLSVNQTKIFIKLKPLIWLACLLPLALFAYRFINDDLGANPFEVLTRDSGEWTLRFLLLTLLMSPLREILGQGWPLAYRRMLGLYTFFYASMHLLTYIWFDQFFDWEEIVLDIIKRPFITLGMLAFFLLLPLAITSTKGMMRRLGRNWKKLHRLIYLIAVLGVLHFLLLVKADLFEPTLYAGILFLLLGYRIRQNISREKGIKWPLFRLLQRT
ncbi:Protein-methionine-sulfoxide reductase heme-binding subunit MsrQ [hydrothermal vent metagenome]|uniref:Protein-methionine-sulfoxide reductase heme-binding subunit MsrQ n=1 Tax=hydrothermal vent metagenome TaxID=652676 RepID=A0A3B1AZW5_9ZZZZ